VGGGSPNAVLCNPIRSRNRSVTERKTHPLFPQIFFRYDRLPGCIQQTHQFRIGFWYILKLFPISHKKTRFPAKAQRALTR
jgi:hypothetical protein